ncbi:hypothetical protein [Paraliomyxa miuraensis]|uniref:hypothetical protein n=1 Tax=Paraliomyxa miuraensis TaxID=376150 RepID=UPI002255F88B|nr:hypothetical protein [Paraliomyxa miuraensis]MCX4239388.1 hypothetical protein [Paraliomyxa miuraensis]
MGVEKWLAPGRERVGEVKKWPTSGQERVGVVKKWLAPGQERVGEVKKWLTLGQERVGDGQELADPRSGVVLTPSELIEKLMALIPPRTRSP